MRKPYILMLGGLLALGACTKPSNNTTNNTTVLPAANPAFTVDGITDVSLDHTQGYYTSTLPLVIEYQDSVQQTVTVSVSGMPATAGGTPNGVFATGVPTFNCTIDFTYNRDSHVIPIGTYPITVTCTGSVSGSKTFKFNFIVY